jgi:hypothetical protein
VTSTVEHAQAPAPSPTHGVTLRDWLLGRPGRAVHLSAAALVLLQLALRGWAAPRGYFSLDDFLFMGRSVSSESLPHFLFTTYNGHFMPGSLLFVKALTAVAPLQYGPVVAVSLVLQAVTSLLVYRVLVRLCGVRPAILVPFAVYLFSVITLPSFLWMAAWIQSFPQQLAMAGATLLHLRYLQEGRRRDAYLGVLAVAAGLMFYEKTILTVGVLFLLTALYYSAGRGLASAWAALRDHRRVWAAYLTLLGAYAAFYLTRDSGALSGPPSPSAIVDTVQAGVSQALLPAFFGGPWQWAPVGFSDASAAPGPLGQVVAFVLAAVVAELAVLAGRGAWRALVLLGLYVAAVETLLVLGRGHILFPSSGGEYRYLSDVALIAAVSLALAFLGPAGTTVSASHDETPTRAAVRRHLRSPLVIAAIVVALLASSSVSLVRFADRLSSNPAKPFLANALHDAAANKGAVVIDTDVPKEVVWPLLTPYHRPSRLLSPVHPDLRFNRLPADRPMAFGPDGHLVRAYVAPGVSNSPGPTRSCGWRVTPARATTVRLTSTLFAWRWAVRLGYIANRDAEVIARAGMTTQTLTIHGGLGETFWYIDGAPDAVQFTTTTPGLVLCTDEVTLGNFAPWTLPTDGAR